MKAAPMSAQSCDSSVPTVDPSVRFKRVLLKMSGEVLMGDREYGIDPATIDRIAADVKQAIELDQDHWSRFIACFSS